MPALLSTVLFLGYFAELYNDFQLMLKILVLIAIATFARNHLGTGALSWIVMAVFAFFIFTDLWKIFGTLYVIYMLLMFGISAIMIDFFFLGGTAGIGGEHAKIEQPISHGVGLAARTKMMQQMRQRAKPPMMR